MDQEETAGSKCNRKEIADQNTSVHSHAKNFPKLIFSKFREMGQDLLQRDRRDKKLFMGQQVLLVLLLKGLS